MAWAIAEHSGTDDEAAIVGINMEGPFISPGKVGAQNPSYVRGATMEEFERWQEAANEDDLSASSDDMSQLLDMVFSPDDNILIGGDEPATFNTEGEDMLGEALPPRSYHRNLEELDELLGSVGNFGFSLKHADDEEDSDDSDKDEE